MLFGDVGKKHQDYLKRYRHMQCIEVAVRDENVEKSGWTPR
ncbi:MAG: hypothetical protein R2760_00155 [Chitinophagales bacterium]